MPRPKTKTAELVNEILEHPHTHQLGTDLLKRFPIHLYTPSPETLGTYLQNYPHCHYDPESYTHQQRIETLSTALALANSYQRDGTILREETNITSPAIIANYIRPYLENLTQEKLFVLALDTKNSVIEQWAAPSGELKRADKIRKKDITAKEEVYKGSLNASIIHPREIFNFAIRHSAANIILAHNHPSGDPTPSPEDINATKEMIAAGKILQIPVLDHIIIGDSGRYISMKEESII